MREISIAIAIKIPEERIGKVMSFADVDRASAIDLILENKTNEQFLIDSIARRLLNDGFIAVENCNGKLSARMNIVITDQEYDRIFQTKLVK